MSEVRYEAVGMTREQAEAVAEVLGHGTVLWLQGHTYPGSKLVVRPMGCKCAYCRTPKTGG